MKISYFFAKLLKIFNLSALKNVKKDKTVYVGKGSNFIDCEIGAYTYFGNNNSLCNVTIGKYCSIASHVSIGGDRHPINNFSTSPVFYKKKNIFKEYFGPKALPVFDEALPVIIGNDVWIGECAFIKGGIKIGDGAIIGAGSIVTHDVPSYAIVGGAPARIIKLRFDNKTIDLLIKSKWWELTPKILSNILEDSPDINCFLERINKI